VEQITSLLQFWGDFYGNIYKNNLLTVQMASGHEIQYALKRELRQYIYDEKVSVHLMITIQKVTSNVQTVPRQSPDIY
jgi:hypothetical protein